MQIEVRPIADDEYEQWALSIGRGFGDVPDRATLDLQRRALEPERALATVDGGRAVGGTNAYSLEMVVPGGRLPTAGVDNVSVLPTHRRRGILTKMMQYQLADCRERGEVLAALGASESIIYGRFGYGIAAHREHWTIERSYAAFSVPDVGPGRCRFVDPEEARKLYPRLSDEAYAYRPGYLNFNGPLWDFFLTDPEHHRHGGGPMFHVVYEANDSVEGFVAYRINDRTLHVLMLTALSIAAHAALWRYCFGVDLMTRTVGWKRPVDDPLPWMLADARRLNRTIVDDLWLRLVDVRRALEGRRYAQEGRLTLAVLDSFCLWNQVTFELVGGPDGAECAPSTATPDITLSAADLAAAYLSGVTFSTLQRAGRVEEGSSEGIQRADEMFATELQPWWPTDL